MRSTTGSATFRAGRSGSLARRVPPLVAAALVLIGVLTVAIRLDAASDGTVVTGWRSDGVVVAVPGGGRPDGLRDGDLVIAIDGHRLASSADDSTRPVPGATVAYQVVRGSSVITVDVRLDRPDPWVMIRDGWGNLVFVAALAMLGTALYLRRPDERATPPLLVAGAGMLGSTLGFTVGVPALILAIGGPVLWSYVLCVTIVYAIGWGGVLAFSLCLPSKSRWSRRTVALAALAPPVALLAVMVGVLLADVDGPARIGVIFAATNPLAAVTLSACGVLAAVAYLRSEDELSRSRLRWLAVGSLVTAVLGLVGWHLPELLLGRQLLPAGAQGLSGLPFVLGIGVALRRHRLFDIERLANRSLTYLAATAVLVTGYAIVAALLVSGLGLSGGVAAALAVAVAAVALAPVLRVAQRTVNRLMYGERDDPAGVLAQLGSRMQAAMLPDDVLPAVVETVAQSLRLPYAAIDLPEETGDFRVVVERGRPVGSLHTEVLSHHGSVVGRLRVSDRGTDDPLEPADLALIRSLAGEIGPAVRAVRLHEDLLRSRAEVVALREDERRRLRRDLHDGLGPALAAIGLKAGLARRDVPAGSRAYDLLGEIDGEVKVSLGGIRRLVEGLRPPALDELGLVGALRTRAATLAPNLDVEVTGELADRCLLAAVEAAAYWIAVEAMTNAARHSHGTRCVVDLRLFHHTLVVVVADDGEGLGSARPPGVGLNSMRERAVEVGGTLVVHAAADGTEVVARLPLDLGAVDGHTDPR